MPNWCHNTLKVSGDEKDVLDFVQRTHEPASGKNQDGTPLFFSSLVPEPNDIGEGWYDWRIQHWGTKWEPSFLSDPGENGHPDLRRTEGSAEYSFDTAWAPPLEWIAQAARMFPELVFTITYGEPGMDSGGKIVFSGEEILSSEEGDAETYLDADMLWC